MSNILLAKSKISEGWCDLSIGEPFIVKDTLFKYWNPPSIANANWEYPEPRGHSPLVKFLESKHEAPIIITNGAKQALGAIFYALKKMGKMKVGMKLPYWALIPPLAKEHGIDCGFTDPDISLTSNVANPKYSFSNEHDSYLLLAPNNPDGQCASYDELKQISDEYRDKNIPFIHDAAYYTHSYLPENYNLGPIGNAQIFSISKMFGLSGLRVGYIACYDHSLVPALQEYMEMMTVGVSNLSQGLLFSLLSDLKSFQKEFESSVRDALKENKKALLSIDSSKLKIPADIESLPGMFAWIEKGEYLDLEKSKVNVIDGKFFGIEGFVRVNLAVKPETISDFVERLK